MISRRVIGLFFTVCATTSWGHFIYPDGSWSVETRKTICDIGSPCETGGHCCLKNSLGHCYYGDVSEETDVCIDDFTGRCKKYSDCSSSQFCKGVRPNMWGTCVTDQCHDGVERCSGHGTCVAQGSGFSCTCNTGWIGEDCSEVHPCDANTDFCGDFGDCVRDGESYTCSCTTAIWRGEFCNINVCDPYNNPCKNDGKCSPVGDSFTCECQPAWAGATCEDAHPCTTTPCANGGTCYPDYVNDPDDFHCKCANNFHGKICADTCGEVFPLATVFPQVLNYTFADTVNYPVDIQCTWIYKKAAGSNLKMAFNYMDIEDAYDSLIVKDDKTFAPDSPYSGSDLPASFTTSEPASKRLRIVFRSDRWRSRTGFMATISEA